MMRRLRTRPPLQLVITLVLALILAYGLQRFVVGFFRVPSASMSRTLLPGDRLLAARFWYSIERPSRGDIVVLHPNGKGDKLFYGDSVSSRVFVKRVIGLPGESIEARHGRIYTCTGPGASGCVPLDEPYVSGTTQTFGPINVPPGRYFVMGDNRKDSEDSRIWGPVRRSQMLGRAFGLAWPPLRIRFF
jgi:signal peptidase I